MDKISEFTERILRCCVPDIMTTNCDIQRVVVSKILKELVEEKNTFDKIKIEEICPHYREINHIPIDHSCTKYFSCAVSGKLSAAT